MYQDEYRDSRTTKSTETLFSVVPVGTCTYRHMSDDDVFHMNINTLEKGLVSREYPVFEASKGNNLEFLVQHINSSEEFKAFCAEQIASQPLQYVQIASSKFLSAINPLETPLLQLFIRLEKTEEHLFKLQAEGICNGKEFIKLKAVLMASKYQ